MANKMSFSSKTILICFLFSILIHKYALIQTTAAADSRKLLEDIPQNTTSNSSSSSNTTEEGKGQSKTGVRGSESKHSGSATGDSPPNSVQTPPPVGLTKVNYVTPTRNQNNGATGGGGGGGGGNYNYGGGGGNYNYGGGINYNYYSPPPPDYAENDDNNNSDYGWP